MDAEITTCGGLAGARVEAGRPTAERTTPTDRLGSPLALSEPQFGQVALDHSSAMVPVDEPGNTSQQPVALSGRQGPVSGVREQQIKVLRCRVRQLPLVAVEPRRPERPRRGQLPVVFRYLRGRLLPQAGWGSWVETLVAVLGRDEERLAATCNVVS